MPNFYSLPNEDTIQIKVYKQQRMFKVIFPDGKASMIEAIHANMDYVYNSCYWDDLDVKVVEVDFAERTCWVEEF